jgi:hypothetical protein
MELVIRMKTITRTLIFLAAVLVWLVILVLVNSAYLRVDELIIIGSALGLSLVTTVGVAKALRT